MTELLLVMVCAILIFTFVCIICFPLFCVLVNLGIRIAEWLESKIDEAFERNDDDV